MKAKATVLLISEMEELIPVAPALEADVDTMTGNAVNVDTRHLCGVIGESRICRRCDNFELASGTRKAAIKH